MKKFIWSAKNFILEVLWPDQGEKLTFFSLTVSSIDNRLYRSSVEADIGPLLERGTWIPDSLVFSVLEEELK